MGMYEKAAEYFRKMISTGSGASGSRIYMRTLILQGKTELAKRLVDSICTLQGCENCCELLSFRLHIMLAEYEKAEKNYDRLTGRGFELYYADSVELALMYRELGRENQSVAILKELEHSVESRLLKCETLTEYLLLGQIGAIRNNKEMMLNNFSKAIQIGLTDGMEDLFDIHPAFKDFREDTEFRAMVREAREIKAAMRAQVNEMEAKGELAL
jgi:hypothetical protein